MMNKQTPWNFRNTDKTLVSPDGLHSLVYYNLYEIAMGAPLGGSCFLESNKTKKIKIHDWCGGPPVWETKGKMFAIPVWTRHFLKGTVQQMGIIDLENLELRIFAKMFRVLDLRSFDKTIISGYDSPIYNTEVVSFDIEEEKTETIIRLNS